MKSRWLWLTLAAFLAWVVWDFARDDRWLVALMIAIGASLMLWWASPLRGRRTTTHREVLEMDDDDMRKAVVVYWRPGCGYCARLIARLGKRGQDATWVNIWADEDAAAFVRSVNAGNETVPTVVLDGVPLTNPEPALVLDRLEELARLGTVDRPD